MGRVALFVIGKGGFPGLEGRTARRVLRCLLSEAVKGGVDLYEVGAENSLKVRDLCEFRGYDVFVLISGKVFITRESIQVLSRIAAERDEFSVIVPVSNESKLSIQIQVPPFSYQTLTVFKWAVREIFERFQEEVVEAKGIDDFCLAFKREFLDRFQMETFITDLPRAMRNRDFRFGIAKGVYVHVYGDCYESGREDLLAHVPLDSRDVLDIGCANGLFGEMLRKRQRCVVTGVDCDTNLANRARTRLDKVIYGDIEKIIEKGTLGKFDCIICGDLLEHLKDPWEVVSRLKRHLNKGGLLIASVPNIAYWAIIYEMLRGRWDYVPFSILSGTHMRFFTKDSLRRCFEDARYRIRELYFQGLEIPPEGMRFIGELRKTLAYINEEELKASEIVIVAEPH